MDEFPGNPNKDKDKPINPEKKKEIEPIELSGGVIKRRKSLGARFKQTFMGGDFRTAAMYVGAAVLIPALKNLIYDMINEGSRRVIYDDPSARGRRGHAGYSTHTNYNNPMSRERLPDPRYPSNDPRSRPSQGERYRVETLLFTNKDDADNVLERMMDVIDQYKVIGVDDLYQMLGWQSTYVDSKWGWTNLVNSNIRQTREGFIVELPDPEPI